MTVDVNSASRDDSSDDRSFSGNVGKHLFHREPVKALAEPLRRAALRKLLLLDAAETLDDLRVPPGNRLEKLAGEREGQYSIRINQQWRICFVWTEGGADAVEIVDYH